MSRHTSGHRCSGCRFYIQNSIIGGWCLRFGQNTTEGDRCSRWEPYERA